VDKRTKEYKAAVAALKALDVAPTVAKPLADARRRLTEKKAKPKKTAAQKAAQTAKARETLNANKPVTLILRAAHTISAGPEVTTSILENGKIHYEPVPGTGRTNTYGPGRVTVSRDIAAVLSENERRLQENNENFDGSRAAFIGPGNRAMGVHPAMFDSPMLNVLEAFHITK
jgi:hypothetical protein